MVVKRGRLSIEASERAAESNGFAAKWGGRKVRRWTHQWVNERVLPMSCQGQHKKVYSLLDDPAIKAELRTYVRTNKWAMNPTKVGQFTENKLLPAAADKYLRHLVNDEMPRGLKKYMELQLFPRIQLKVGKGISLTTARRWLRNEGFRYISHQKGLYFDGHDRPDVLAYRQKEFLPTMAAHTRRLVQYVVGDVDREVGPPVDLDPESGMPVKFHHLDFNFVERCLVLCAHDEMTAQGNDAQDKNWVFESQHMLRKKGVGRGRHQSDVICSTTGWLKEASQSMEYGKNYEGYWTGEMFVKQV